MNHSWQRASGIAGVLGGLTLFTGDLLFLADLKNNDFLSSMAQNTDARITASGLTALLASWLYVLGLGQIYYAFKPSKPIFRNTMLVSLGGILIAYGVAHGSYVAIAATAKVAAQNNLDLTESTKLAKRIYDLIVLLVYPVFAVSSFVFIKQVWQKKTLYPRWMIFFFPLIPFLLQWILDPLLSGKAWIIIMGGYLNLIMVVFFTASTIALWNKRWA